jgi:hypothetical protein
MASRIFVREFGRTLVRVAPIRMETKNPSTGTLSLLISPSHNSEVVRFRTNFYLVHGARRLLGDSLSNLRIKSIHFS